MKRRITLELGEDLLGVIDRQARHAKVSRARFIVGAVERHIAALERQRIDVEFDEMAQDAGCCAELCAIEIELAPASLAAWSAIGR